MEMADGVEKSEGYSIYNVMSRKMPGNVTDAQGLENVCPDQGAIYADRAYCTEPAKRHAAKKQYHLAAIKKNNMKAKNKDNNR